MDNSYDSQYPHAHLRLQGWDYSSPDWYFLTACCHDMNSFFGNVVNQHMVLNDAGRIAGSCWLEIPTHFPQCVLDEFVVMPNHIHGLIRLLNDTTAAPISHSSNLEAFGRPVAGSIPTIMRSYKGAVTRAIGRKVWQRRFYDVRPRDEAALDGIREYIRHNPENFAAVTQSGEPQYLGNRGLLNMPKVGFLASRPQGSTNIRSLAGLGSITDNRSITACRDATEVVVSGFLSPMERAVFRACLESRHPLIWVVPFGLGSITACRDATEACRDATEARRDATNNREISAAINEGRLLLVSPFAASTDIPNARRAIWCNQYVLGHCERLVIGHLNPDGMLACLLAELNPDVPVLYL